jgi:acyl-CoA synthetase (AMP-forming)/AMP-acid ligase II
VINCGGKNIYLANIEDFLINHQKIQGVAAIGVLNLYDVPKDATGMIEKPRRGKEYYRIGESFKIWNGEIMARAERYWMPIFHKFRSPLE